MSTRIAKQAVVVGAGMGGLSAAAALFGGDPRIYLTTAKKFEGDDAGHVKAVHTVQIEWGKNDKGQFVPKEVPGSYNFV